MNGKKMDRRSLIKAVGLATVATAIPTVHVFSKDIGMDARPGHEESSMSGGIYHVAKRNVPEFAVRPPDIPFVPRRAASWWLTLDDLQWSQKHIRDKIKRRPSVTGSTSGSTFRHEGGYA